MNNKELGFQHCWIKPALNYYLKLTATNKLNHSILRSVNPICAHLIYQCIVKKINNLSNRYRFSNNNAKWEFEGNKIPNNTGEIIAVDYFAFK